MKFIGEGCLSFFVEEWNKVFRSSENCVVIQPQSISGVASMRIRNGIWEIDLGQ